MFDEYGPYMQPCGSPESSSCPLGPWPREEKALVLYVVVEREEVPPETTWWWWFSLNKITHSCHYAGPTFLRRNVYYNMWSTHFSLLGSEKKDDFLHGNTCCGTSLHTGDGELWSESMLQPHCMFIKRYESMSPTRLHNMPFTFEWNQGTSMLH